MPPVLGRPHAVGRRGRDVRCGKWRPEARCQVDRDARRRRGRSHSLIRLTALLRFPLRSHACSIGEVPLPLHRVGPRLVTVPRADHNRLRGTELELNRRVRDAAAPAPPFGNDVRRRHRTDLGPPCAQGFRTVIAANDSPSEPIRSSYVGSRMRQDSNIVTHMPPTRIETITDTATVCDTPSPKSANPARQADAIATIHGIIERKDPRCSASSRIRPAGDGPRWTPSVATRTSKSPAGESQYSTAPSDRRARTRRRRGRAPRSAANRRGRVRGPRVHSAY